MSQKYTLFLIQIVFSIFFFSAERVFGESKKPDGDMFLPKPPSHQDRELLLDELFSITKGHDKLKALSSLTFNDYPQKIGNIKEEISQFLENKRGVCTGDYLPLLLNDPAFAKFSSRSQIRKLSLIEKKNCFKNLFEFQKKYLAELFSLRKKYLNYLHQKRIQDLDLIQKQTLQKLNENYQNITKE